MNLLHPILTAVVIAIGIILAVPVASLIVPFWIVTYLTKKGCYFFEAPSSPWDHMIEFDPTVGWKPKAYIDVHSSFIAGVFHWKTDAQGWRGQTSIEQSQILVFGDSYAFGYAMDEANLFTNLHSQCSIKGIGAPGYNMVQGLLWMQKLSLQMKGKLVVWFICVSNDIYDNLQLQMQGYKSPFVRKVDGSEEWEVVTSHLSPVKWLYNEDRDQERMRKGRYTAAFGNTSLTERAYAACEFLLRKGNDVCQAAGGKLVVITVPHMAQLNDSEWEKTIARFGDSRKFNRNLPDEKFAEICQHLSIPFVAGKTHLRFDDHILEDGHWNVKGHQRIAAVLSELYARHMGKPGQEDHATKINPLNLHVLQTAK